MKIRGYMAHGVCIADLMICSIILSLSNDNVYVFALRGAR